MQVLYYRGVRMQVLHYNNFYFSSIQNLTMI